MDTAKIAQSTHRKSHPKGEASAKPALVSRWLIIGLLLGVLFALLQFNPPLFHSAVEILGVVVAAAIFILVWNAPSSRKNTSLSILGAGYPAVALLDFLHVFSVPGMNVFIQATPDTAVQLWIGARLMESTCILLAVVFLERKVNAGYLPVISFGICAALLAAIFVWPVFPAGYLPGAGVTGFKIGCESAILISLLAAIFLLHRRRRPPDNKTRRLLSGAVWATIAAEVALMFNADAYGLLSWVGHCLKLISICLIFIMIMEKVHLHSLSGEKDGPGGGMVRLTHISESEQLERHLAHSEKMSTLGMLVAGMVHEIKNPNSFISLNLPILRAYLGRIFQLLDTHPQAGGDSDWFGMDYPSFRRETYCLLGNLSRGSTRIENIIADLKAMIHPGHKPNKPKWVHLDSVIEKAVVLCRGEIKKQVKTFKVHPSHSDIQLKTDPQALEQVVINLLINAAHAADKEDSWVKIENRRSSDQIDEVVIDVSDNGCGMDKETMARIFDPFFTTKGPGIGTGLGLSVSHSLVDRLGGKIVVSSKPGRGSSFKVMLPREADSEAGGRVDEGGQPFDLNGCHRKILN